MTVLICAAAGFLLDLLLGDPALLTPFHPVVWMGHAIHFLERRLRKRFPATPEGERQAGRILAFTLPVAVLALSFLLLTAAASLWPPLGILLQIIWCWQALAVKNLRDESAKVFRALTRGTLEEARQAVSRIVGRDTASLAAEGVTRAAVETVAENFSDGVIAPLFYMLLGGAPLALAYKSINTMDSMVGYKNDRYLWFGRAAAHLDDAANFIPARLAAWLLMAAAALTGCDAKGAFRIWRRDRRKHASPNAAQCEAVMAGALGVQLAGPASYFGRRVEKPWIGDALRPVQPEDIILAGRMLYAGSILGMVVFGLIRFRFFCG